MRRTILLLSLCLAVSVFAQNKNDKRPHRLTNKVAVERKIQKIEAPVPFMERAFSVSSAKALKAKASIEANRAQEKYNINGWLESGTVRANAQSDSKEQIDSVVMHNNANQKVSRQYFIYNDQHWSIKRINSLWDASTSSWAEVEVYTFARDDEGYVLSQQLVYPEWNEGSKEEFVYEVINGMKLGISCTISYMLEGVWFYDSKEEYKYDNRGNISEQVILMYDPDASEWIPSDKLIAEYDEKNRQNAFESYYWTGMEWEGLTKQYFVFNNDGDTELYLQYLWAPATKDWFCYYKLENVFENGRIDMQTESFWNKTKGDWSGIEEYNGVMMYCGKTTFEYDDKGREIYELYQMNKENGWQKEVDIEKTWTETDKGANLSQKMYYYTSADNKEFRKDLWVEYNTLGLETYVIEKHLIDGVWTSLYEEAYSWDTVGNLLGSQYWEYVDGQKLAYIAEEYVYDTDNNVIESHHAFGQGTGADDWINVSRFTYIYENNVRIEKMAYMWNEDHWIANWGEGMKYDYSILNSDLILPTELADKYKIIEAYDYVGAGTDWEVNTFVYHYSKDGVSNLTNVNENAFSVYPNPVVDVLSINSNEDAEINVYSVQGAKLISTVGRQVNMSNLVAGFYIVEVNGTRMKIMKK